MFDEETRRMDITGYKYKARRYVLQATEVTTRSGYDNGRDVATVV
jgi:hypothetical protein